MYYILRESRWPKESLRFLCDNETQYGPGNSPRNSIDLSIFRATYEPAGVCDFLDF